MTIAAAMTLGLAGTAGAEGTGPEYVGPTSTVVTNTTVLEPQTDVLSANLENTEASQSAAATSESAANATQVESATLAFTGGDILALVGIALGAIVVGALILTARRRSATA